MDAVGVSLASIAVVYALSYFVLGFVRLPAGAFADFYSKKLLLLASLMGVPIYIYGMTLASTAQHFILLKILFAAIFGLFWTPLMGIFLDKVRAGAVGSELAKRSVVAAVAGALAGLGAGVFIDSFGFISLFRLALIISFVPILLGFLVTEEKMKRRFPSFKETEQEYREIILTKGFLLLLAFGLIQSAVFAVWLIYTPIYLSNNIGLSMSMIGLLFAINSAASIPIHIPRGKLTDKFHAKWLIIPGFFLAWFSGYAFLRMKDFIGLVVSRYGVRLGLDLIWSPSAARVAEMTTKEKHAGASALFYSLGNFGAGFAALVAGYMISFVGVRSTLSYFINVLLIFGFAAFLFHKYMRWKYRFHYKRHHLLHLRPLYGSERQ